jgi:hypothetical protein
MPQQLVHIISIVACEYNILIFLFLSTSGLVEMDEKLLHFCWTWIYIEWQGWQGWQGWLWKFSSLKSIFFFFGWGKRVWSFWGLEVSDTSSIKFLNLFRSEPHPTVYETARAVWKKTFDEWNCSRWKIDVCKLKGFIVHPFVWERLCGNIQMLSYNCSLKSG